MPKHRSPAPSAATLLEEAIAALLERSTFEVVGGSILQQTDIRRIIFHEEYEAFRRSLPDPPQWGAAEVERIGNAICDLVACHRGFLCDPEVSKWIEHFAEDQFSFVSLQREKIVGAWEESGRWLRQGRDLTEEERANVHRWIDNTLLFFSRLGRAVSGQLGRDKRSGVPGWGMNTNRERAMVFAWGKYSDGDLERAIAEWEGCVEGPKSIQTWKQANRQRIKRWIEILEPFHRRTHKERLD